MDRQDHIIYSPIPQRPTTPHAELTAKKIAWLYNSLAVLQREADRLVYERDCEDLRVNLLRKLVLKQAKEDSP